MSAAIRDSERFGLNSLAWLTLVLSVLSLANTSPVRLATSSSERQRPS